MLRKTCACFLFVLSFVSLGWSQTERYFVVDTIGGTANRVRAYDVATDVEQTSFLAGMMPYELAVSPNHRLGFVANVNNNYVSVIDFTTGTELAPLRNLRARSLAVSPDGTKLVVPLYDGTSRVAIVNTADFSITYVSVAAYMPGEMAGVVVANNRAFITSTSTATCGVPVGYCPVLVIDLSTNAPAAITGTNTGQGRLHNGIAATPDGAYVVATSYSSAAPNYGHLLKISTTPPYSYSILGPLNYSPSGIVIGSNPSNPSQFIGYVSQDNTDLSVVDVSGSTFSLIRTIAGGIGFGTNNWYYGMGLKADGTRLYISSNIQTGNNLGIFDTTALITGVGVSVISRYHIDGSPQSLTVASVYTSPVPGGPIITSVSPNRFTNETVKTITIDGSNFCCSANPPYVRFGNLAPAQATWISGTQIQAIVPQGAAVQTGNVVVSNPGSTVADQNTSGILANGITIDPPLSFQPLYAAWASSVGQSFLWPLGRGFSPVEAIQYPRGFAFSPLGTLAFTGSSMMSGVSITDLSTGLLVTPSPKIPLNTTAGFREGVAVVNSWPRTPSGPVGYAVSGIGSVAPYDEQLTAFDVNSPSGTIFYSLPATMNSTSATSRGAMVAVPNGNTVFELASGSGGQVLVVYDLILGNATPLPVASYSIYPNAAHLHVTPDGRFLLMRRSDGSSIGVYDISGTVQAGSSPANPVLVNGGTITGTGGLCAASPSASWQWFQVDTPRLYAFDPVQHMVAAFNFIPTVGAPGDFTCQGTYTLSTPASVVTDSMSLGREGSYLYVTLKEENAVAILDANKVLLGDPTALIAKVATGLGPDIVMSNPVTTAAADLAVSINPLPGPVDNGSDVTYSITVTNNGSNSATGVTLIDTLPAGATFVSSTPAVCNGTTTVVCDLGSLPVTSTVVTITATVHTSGTNTNQVQVSANERDINTANNAASIVTTVSSVGISVAPTSVSVNVSRTQQFAATVTGNVNTAVNWTVTGAGCSGSTCGTVDGAGLYTAPAVVPVPAAVTVTATSQADNTKSASATVTVLPAITVAVAPATTTLSVSGTQLFTATVSNAANTSVNWSLSGPNCTGISCGIVTTGGLYTAPTSAPTPNNTVTVTATSVDDPTKTGTATVTVTPVVIGVAPTSASVNVNRTQQFTATVTGTPNTSVNWTATGTGCSGATCGTVDGSGLYTAPAVVPAPAAVTVTATSQADNTKSASATVTVLPAITVSVAPTTASVPASTTRQFTATVTNSTNTNVNWSLSGASCSGSTCGTVDSAGLYTAPISVPSPTNTVTVTASSVDDPTKSATATVTVTPLARMSIAMAGPGSPVQASSTFTYNITVNNSGPSTATNVTVTDTLPAGVSLVRVTSSQGNCTALPCVLGTMNSGTTATVAIEANANETGTYLNTATVAATEADPNPADNTASASVNITPLIDLAINVTASAPSVAVNTTFTYNISVVNIGPSTATNVTVSDALPAGVSLVGVSSSQGGCTALPCNLGSLAGLSATTATITIQVTALSAGNWSNAASVSAPEPDFDTTNNASTAVVAITSAMADLAVTVAAPATPLYEGSAFGITITVRNNGPSSASGIVLSLGMASGLLPVGATASQGTIGGLLWTVGSLASGASATGTLQFSPPMGTETFTAAISNAVESDSVPANNSASVMVTVTRMADLALTMGATQPVPHTPTVVYTATVSNTGPSTATGVTFNDTLPGALSIISANTTQGTCSAAANVSCTIGTLAKGAQAVVTITTTAMTTGMLNNTATVLATEADTTANNSATVALASTDLYLQPAASPVVTSGMHSHEVMVMNNGADAHNVVFTDVMSRYTLVSATAQQGTCSGTGSNVRCQLGTVSAATPIKVTVVVKAPTTGWASHTFQVVADEVDPTPYNNIARVTDDLDLNTKPGSDVSVQTTDAATGTQAIVTFSNVTQAGTTALSMSSSFAPVPAGFRNGAAPLTYDLRTTATFSGPVSVVLSYDPAAFHHPGLARLFHYENGAWVDRTAALDVAGGRIAATTTSLSPFAVFEPQNRMPVANAGGDRVAPGNLSVGAAVALNGAGSSDADEDALTYRWSGPFPEGGGSVTGATPQVTLPFGTSKLTLVVNDGEANSAPTTVNVTVADFMVAVSGTNSTARGQSATYTVAVAPRIGPFEGAVSLGCANLPAGMTCSFSPSTVMPGQNGASATLTISTGGIASKRAPLAPLYALWVAFMAMPAGMAFAGKGRRIVWRLLVVLAVLLAALLVGCGGSGGVMSNSPPQTSASTYSVTVSGTSGSLQHTAIATVTVH